MRRRANSGKNVARRSTNPVPPTRGQLRDAAELFEQFTGHEPEHVDTVKIRVPNSALRIGDLDGVLYTTVRDGKTEKYIHRFKRNSRPSLAASHDGKTLVIVGGQYEFTEKGIEDK